MALFRKSADRGRCPGSPRPAPNTSLHCSVRGVILAQVGLPAAHGRGARAKPVFTGSRTVARRVAPGAEAVGPFEPAAHGLREVGHPSRAVALPTGMVVPKDPLTAHEGYLRSGGKRRTLLSPRRVRRRSRRTP